MKLKPKNHTPIENVEIKHNEIAEQTNDVWNMNFTFIFEKCQIIFTSASSRNIIILQHWS